MFKETFDDYVCIDDTVSTEVEGFVVRAAIEHDIDSHIDDDDCHNTDQDITGCSDEQQDKLLEARQAWFGDEWFYCGVVLSVYRNGVCLTDNTSVWGIEANYPGSDNTYLIEIADDLLPEALEEAKEVLKALVE